MSKFQIGQMVKWTGQQGECRGTIANITHPENSGYVLHVDVGEGVEDFPIGENEVELLDALAGSAERTELKKAVARWVEAKRQHLLREDREGDLQHEVQAQERDVEDAIVAELESNT